MVLGLVCLLSGVSLSLTAVSHITDLGINAPYLHNIIAFNEPATSELTDVLGPAAKTVDNMTLFVTIAVMATAATLLIVASALFLTSGHLRHPMPPAGWPRSVCGSRSGSRSSTSSRSTPAGGCGAG